MAKYVYPVILTPAPEGGYTANFPDLQNCFTEGDNLAEALEMAKDVLALTLTALEDDKKDIPKPSEHSKLNVSKDNIVSLVSADTTEYRKMYDNKAVKKTLTIPSWLNTIAEANDINFSAVLQTALKKELKL
ncbi:MAG: type II toxin-antitoxin system HicB family antitoxin [Lachnospiraceae bacterium]|nr:type II toxin-antitoxin system HicB family antitoxin [Lachnospiraceae bacterium]